MPVVQHGRRCGQTRAPPVHQKLPFPDPKKCDDDCIDIRKVKVLSQKEWERLNYLINQEAIEAEQREREKKATEELIANSKDMIKDWSSTFMGSQTRRLEERERRLAAEEEARKALDQQEAEYQAVQRKKAIDKAKLQLYYQSDRVKSFNSALVLTEILKERDAQIEFKHLKKKLDQQKDQIYVQKFRKDLEEAIRKDQEELARRRDMNMSNAESLKQQILDRQEEERQLREGNFAEGEALQRQLKADEMERQRLDGLDKEFSRKLMEEYKEQMSANSQMREYERIREEELEEQCRIFCAAKRKMLRMRAQKEQQLKKEKEEQLDRIREYLSSQLQAEEQDEDERIRKAQAEKEAEFLRKEEEKKRKQAKQQEEINKHRLEQIELHKQEERERIEAGLNEKRELEAAEAALQKYENRCYEKVHKTRRDLALQYRDEAERRVKENKDKRIKEIEISGTGNKLAMVEEKVFQDYAQRVIKHCEAHGRNVVPLVAASRPAPDVGGALLLPGQPTFAGEPSDGTNECNVTSSGIQEKPRRKFAPSTYERLGLVWPIP